MYFQASSGPLNIESSSSQDSLERLRAELDSDLACVKAVVEEVVGGDPGDELEELASLPAGSRHGVGRKLSGPEVENRNISPVSLGTPVARKISSGSADRTKTPSPNTGASDHRLSPMGEMTKSGTSGERRLSSLDPGQRKVSSVNKHETPERRKSSKSSSPPVPEQRQSLITDNQELGARPRISTASSTPVTPAARKMSEVSDTGSVLLKQSSWGSSRWVAGAGVKKPQETPATPTSSSETPGEKAVTSSSGNSFLRRKDLWERRSMSSPSDGEKAGHSWGSKTTPRPSSKTSNTTPDLVMDLPTGPLASSPPIPAPRPLLTASQDSRSRSPSSDSVSSSSGTESASRASWSSSARDSPARHTTADNFAAADTDTMRKHGASKTLPPSSSPAPLPVFRTNILASSTPASSASTPTSFRTASSVSATKTLFSAPGSGATPKPAVKVKPILQVKPSEIKKENANPTAKE